MPRKPDGQIVKRKDAEADVLGTLDRFKPELVRVLPKYVSVDRLARIATTSLRNNPKLFACTKTSLFSCIMQVATLNLEPDTLLQHAHLIPFGNECTLVIGYRGMRELVERTGKVSHVETRAVFEGDEFSFRYGLDPDITHVPCGKTEKLTHAYAVVVYRDGFKKFDVMNREEIDAVRARSKAGKSGPWVEHFAEMAKKTVLKRALKAEPMSAELTTAISLDDAVDANVKQKFDVGWEQVEAAKQEPIEVTATPVEGPRSDEDKAKLEGE